MISFDLRCSGGHVFEAWFRSSTAWEEQAAASLVTCPVCNDSEVTKAVMAPNISAKGNTRPLAARAPAEPAASLAAGSAPVTLPTKRPSPAQVKAAVAVIAAHQAKQLETSQWVGRTFAEKARAMHDGDLPETPIHGQATAEEARELVQDGVPVAPLLVPVVPPELAN